MAELTDIVNRRVKDVISYDLGKGNYSNFILFTGRFVLHEYSDKSGNGSTLYTVKQMQEMLKKDQVIPEDIETFKKIIEFYRPKR